MSPKNQKSKTHNCPCPDINGVNIPLLLLKQCKCCKGLYYEV